MKRPPCAWNIPSLATGSSSFVLTPTQTLTPLHLATRIEAAKRHWRAHWACKLTLAHPGFGAGGGPPQQTAKPRVPGPIYDTYKGRLHCRHFRRQVAESWTCYFTSCFHTSVYFLIVYYPNKFCYYYQSDCYAAANFTQFKQYSG